MQTNRRLSASRPFRKSKCVWTPNFKPQTPNFKPQTSNPKPQTPNFKHQTSNPK
jgi:hypothetical protein